MSAVQAAALLLVALGAWATVMAREPVRQAVVVSLYGLALGILFFLASLSRATLETPLGTMRLEMPAIAALAVAWSAPVSP